MMTPSHVSHGVELGLGLLEIGKPWGHVPTPVPDEEQAVRFLEFAFEFGIRYFDTAASYAVAEQRFGRFLRTLDARQRAEVTVATKFGEHWDFERNEPYVDHSYDALAGSLERSLELLGPIDVLQLHKPTPEVLASGDLARAWELARSCGVKMIGPSVSDLESARIACESGLYQMLQLPLNSASPKFLEIAALAHARGLYVAVNRPFAMGALLYEAGPAAAQERRIAALEFILKLPLHGVVLTGTKSPAHLTENHAAFVEAKRRATAAAVLRYH